MENDIDEILEGAVSAEPPAEPEPQETPAEPEVEAEAPPEPTPDPQPQMVPLSALQETRAELREVKQMLESANRPEPVKPPEFLDPEGSQFLAQQVQAMGQNMRLELSEAKARLAHGDGVVDAALQAAREAGTVGQFIGKPDAWSDLVKWHKRELVAKEVGDDPDAYRDKIKAEIRKEVEAEMVAKQATAAQPAPSLAGSTSATATGAPQQNWSPASLGDILG